jgi:hypothetical protein
MQRPAYWLQSDLVENRQFRRCWMLPSPKRQRPALAPTSNRPLIKNLTSTFNYSENADKAEARRAAEALFSGGCAP